MCGDTVKHSRTLLQRLNVTIILIVISFLGVSSSETPANEVCYARAIKNTPTRVSFLVPTKVISSEWCFSSWTLRCETETTKWATSWKTENITRVQNIPTCCPGYTGKVGACVPICTEECERGECTAPEICTCEAGYSGNTCQEMGCPPAKWGEDCKNNCTCSPGSSCDSVTGDCICPPGFTGEVCADRCPQGSFGSNCTGTCNCTDGHYCHHIIGECLPCLEWKYGKDCSSDCNCDRKGTALCSLQKGRCYCKSNYFGSRCATHCPFGFINGTCNNGGSEGGCECPNDLYECDPVEGCVCPPGVDCGIEEATQVAIGFSQASHGRNGIIIAVSTILGFGLIIMILMIIYYRRRIKNIKRDLHNRSQVSFPEPDMFNPSPLPAQAVLRVAEHPNNTVDLNNVQTDSCSGGIDNPLYIVNYSKPEKNTNIEQSRQVGSETKDEVESVYHEPREIINAWSLMDDFQSKYGVGKNIAGEEEDEDDTYDHLDHKRFNNDASPRYFNGNKNQ